MGRIPCMFGLHRWETSAFPTDQDPSWSGGRYTRIRKVCCQCPTRKYGWKRFGLEHTPFAWTDDRTSWSANPAILDPKRKKVTR